jgi:hypothetical protein
LLAVLFYELLDFSAFSDVVACGVVHRATCATIIAIGYLVGTLVAPWAPAPTYRCCRRSGRGTGQWLIVATSLLVVVVVVLAAASLGCSIGDRLAVFSHLWGRQCMPDSALRSPGALVREAEELGNILDVVHSELLQHLLIRHTLAKCNHNRSIGDTRNGIANLRKPLDERA